MFDPRIRENCVNVRVKNVILASLEEKRLVKQGRKIYEEDDLRARKMGDTELEERRKKFREEKIKMFEKIITTPTRRKKKEESERKTTPLSLRKIGKSSQKRKVYGARERERGKISEGLRLGAASTCRKFGNFEMKIARKLVMTEGADKIIFEGASPPHNRVAGIKNLANPLARQERAEKLDTRGFVRKDVIGLRQEETARPGARTNRERCDREHGQVTGHAAQAAGGLPLDLRNPYE